jgi:hypothetical protein
MGWTPPSLHGIGCAKLGVSVVVNKDVTSGYGVRQPIEYKKDVVPRTPNPTYGMWLGCLTRLNDSEYLHSLGA